MTALPYATNPLWESQSDDGFRELLGDSADYCGSAVLEAMRDALDYGLDTGEPQTLERILAVARKRSAPTIAVEREVQRRSAEATVVYFIRSGDHVKIGTTVKGADKRFAAMQLPPDAQLVAVIPKAGRADEQRLHGMFATCRVRGEWFKVTPELAALIESFRV